MTNTVKPGDDALVSFKGKVTRVLSPSPECWDVGVKVSTPGGDIDTFVRHEHVTVIEPKYETGALYLSAGGGVYERTRQGYWREANSARIYPDSLPTRPLRKLVPEAAR